MLDVVGIDKLTFSILRVYDFVGLLIGAQFFKYFFRHYEFRSLVIAHAVVALLICPLNVLFTTRKNLEWGIPDMFIILFTGGIEDIFFMCMILLPMVTMFTKICPKGVEATCYALILSVANLRGTIRAIESTNHEKELY